MRPLFYLFLTSIIFFSCSRNSVNDKINTVGEVAGEAAGSFAKGIGNGVTKAFEGTIDLQKSLESQGIKFGKSTISNDTAGTDNLLSLYIIFEKDFSGTLTAKIFDSKNREMGRNAVTIVGTASEARYVDFHFSERTNIDSDCKITLE